MRKTGKCSSRALAATPAPMAGRWLEWHKCNEGSLRSRPLLEVATGCASAQGLVARWKAHLALQRGLRLPWNLHLDELLRRLYAKPGGLADRDANRRLAEYGPNDALMHRRRQLWRQIIERLANPLIIILLFASGLSAWTGEVTSFVIIVVIILLSVVLDVAQQRRAENTID